MRNSRIDAGAAFDFGRTSADYAVYRDIYPEVFYEKIAGRGFCIKGQKVLDIGTGTGVLPRSMYHYGADWTGVDISENQIVQAKLLAKRLGMNINFISGAAEDVPLPDSGFDLVTACQCFWYFDCEKLIPTLLRALKPDGTLLILYMAWLPYEDDIAGASEELVLKYSPNWTGRGERVHPISVPERVYQDFDMVHHEEYRLDVPFTRELWHGRMKTCRGIGASLSPEEIEKWESEHRRLLDEIAPDEFNIKHYAAMLELKRKP